MINIYIDSIYACHIAYYAYILKLDFNIISLDSNKIFDFNGTDYFDYYERMVNKLYDKTQILLEPTLFEYFIKNTFTFNNSTNILDIDIHILNSNSLKDVENEFLQQLDSNNIIKYLYKYELNFDTYKNSIILLYNLILNRSPTNNEIDYYYIYDHKKGIYTFHNVIFTNLFSLIHILYFNNEGRQNNLHLPWITLFKSIKFNIILKIPKFALILSGYSRDFINYYESHKIFIENPYIDIFIHTWNLKGPRYEYLNEKTDIITLTKLYNPTQILVENVISMQSGFSLLGKITPIFLVWDDCQGDDATRYINAQLYSLWKAMELIKNYEITHNISYNGIIKMNFNINIINLNFKGIVNDISPTIFGQLKNALYSPNLKKIDNIIKFNDREPYTLGGCSRCMLEAKYIHFNYIPQHTYHYNDISNIVFWTNRILGQKACELYLNALQIMENNHANNIINYQNVRYKQFREFIYIQEPEFYQAKVYSINDINKPIVCFYIERLMREHMINNTCLTSDNIKGEFKDFDILTNKI